MRLRFLFALVLIFRTADANDLPGDYFPDRTFGTFATKEWFGPYLFSLHEPSLYRLSQRSPSTVYRLAVLPPFGEYSVLTLYVQPGGRGRLELKKAAQVPAAAGDGYLAGPLERHAVFILTHGAVERFQRLLQTMHFWQLPPTRNSTILDADTFLYEAARAGRYHVVEIETPGSDRLLEPAKFLLKVAGETMPD